MAGVNPTLEQLARYFAQELDRGVPESSVYASLRAAGWTAEWLNAALAIAKQRAAPTSNDITIPDLYEAPSDEAPSDEAPSALPESSIVSDASEAGQQSTSSSPAAERHLHQGGQPESAIPTIAQSAAQPHQSRAPYLATNPYSRTSPKPIHKTKSHTLFVKRMLVAMVIILSLVVIGLGALRILQANDVAAKKRLSNDVSRREDLSLLLSNLSDYYVAHDSYPTRAQLNDASFAEKQGFNSDMLREPLWSAENPACSNGSLVQLASLNNKGCYTYLVEGEKGSICNNDSRPCSRVTVTIPLQAGGDKTQYTVSLYKNTQVN